MRKKHSNLILVLVLLVGLSILAYPIVSDWVNAKNQSHLIADYSKAVESIDDAGYEALFAAAGQYNRALLEKPYRWLLSDEELAAYNEILDVTGNGVMGYVEIPCISVFLPVFHGANRDVLQVAAGHVEGSSLPVGGESTHSVISAHRGMPSSKLFTDLDQVELGDIFTFSLLNRTLAYEVDQILVVLPQELEALEIEEGQDYFTLVTCTPYGVNSHRLLVRGHRIETAEEAGVIRITADAVRIDPLLVAACIAAPVLALLFIIALCAPAPKRRIDL